MSPSAGGRLPFALTGWPETVSCVPARPVIDLNLAIDGLPALPLVLRTISGFELWEHSRNVVLKQASRRAGRPARLLINAGSDDGQPGVRRHDDMPEGFLVTGSLIHDDLNGPQEILSSVGGEYRLTLTHLAVPGSSAPVRG